MSKFQELSSLIWSVADDVLRGLFQPIKKSLGSKRKEICPGQRLILLDTCTRFGESEISKIYPSTFFGYTKVTIEQPLTEDGQVKSSKNGNPMPDSSFRDYERIPLGTSIDEYYQREVKPHLPNSWMDRGKDKIGYEINFTKYFYKYKPCGHRKRS